jgi:hypothetical protein
VVGRAINVNGRPHTIIGVMPPRFAFPETQRLWVAIAEYGEKTSRDYRLRSRSTFPGGFEVTGTEVKVPSES